MIKRSGVIVLSILVVMSIVLSAATWGFAQEIYDITGIVRNEQGIPIEGLSVTLEKTYDNGLFSSVNFAKTVADGSYIMTVRALDEEMGSWYTLYISGRGKPCGPSEPDNYTYDFLEGQYANQDFIALPGVPVQLSWALDQGFESDGIEPNNPQENENVIFKVGAMAAMDSWNIRNILLHVQKDGQEIEGSPFEMPIERVISYGPSFKAIYSNDISFSSAGNYVYYFEGVDAIGDQAQGDPVQPLGFTVNEKLTIQEAIRMEADYILQCQFMEAGNPALGAINNIIGDPTWIVPGENAIAIIGLIAAADFLKDDLYRERAEIAADYLLSVQNKIDGAWHDQYEYENVTDQSKSLRHTVEVMIALDKLGYRPERYGAMRAAAEFVLLNQDIINKGGYDDGLVCGGKDANGNFNHWRWASDNSFAYQALQAAKNWALAEQQNNDAQWYSQAANEILNGIHAVLAVTDTHWKRVIDEWGNLITGQDHYDWISYAPAMMDLPLGTVDPEAVGDWIHTTLQKEDGAVVWDEGGGFEDRKSPGYSFQGSLVWIDTGQAMYAEAARTWAEGSSLWQLVPDGNNVVGGWIDWIQKGDTSSWWDRFIDTSAYYIFVCTGGVDFNPEPISQLLQIEYAKSADRVRHKWFRFNFTTEFSERPALFATMQTTDGGDTAGLRIRNLYQQGFKVKVEEEKSRDKERKHTTEVVGFLALNDGLLCNRDEAIIGEVGCVTTMQPNALSWQTITLQQAYDNPVVFAQMNTCNGRQPSHIRIKNVTPQSFEMQIEEWDYLDGWHKTELIAYLVIEKGTHKIAKTTTVEVGTEQISHKWKTISLTHVFAEAPVVISQSQTCNEEAAIVTRQRNITFEKVQVRLKEEENSDNRHTKETVAYLAIE